MQFESLKRGEGECGKQSIKETITNNFSILKKTSSTNPECLMNPKHLNTKKKLHRENHTEFLQHKTGKNLTKSLMFPMSEKVITLKEVKKKNEARG